MRDASGGDVLPDPDATIDAAAPPDPLAPAPPPVVVRPAAPSPEPAVDHASLLPVERRHYTISRELAKGGMGRILEARDLRLGRHVAIKELLPQHRDAARRFEREARITARLQHPSIIHVYEAGVWPGGEPFYAMPLVPGRSLDEAVEKRTTLNSRLALLPHAIAVADAIAYAHHEGVIHRDLKPANVLVGEFGETVVIDWGLAKDLGDLATLGEVDTIRPRVPVTTGDMADQTQAGGVVGTPAYMPPEQARGEALDARADVYALGALLYKILAGVAPYTGPRALDVIRLVKAGPPRPLASREPGVPPDLAAIVDKAMAREPAARYATAGEVAAELKRFQTGQLVAAHRYTARQLLWRWLRRNRLPVAIATIAAVTLAVTATVSVLQILASRDHAEREQARAEARRAALLEERGRAELLAGHAGAALAYLRGALDDGHTGGARGFLIAEARRPFEAERQRLTLGADPPTRGNVAIAVAPDGHHLATALPGGLALWELGDEATLTARLGDHGVQLALAFDPQGRQLAAAGKDGTARVWSLDGSPGRSPVELAGHRGEILALDFSPDGRQLVTAGRDTTARIWDLASGGPALVSRCHQAPVSSARFAPDGALVATSSDDSTGCVVAARAAEGFAAGETVRELHGHRDRVNAIAWIPDEREDAREGDREVVTAGDDGQARVFNAVTGKLVVEPLRHDGESTVVVAEPSHDGRYVLTGGNDRVPRLWALPTEVPTDGSTPAAQGKRFETGGGGTIGGIIGARFSADDALIATAGSDGIARVWDRATRQQVAAFEHPGLDAVAFALGGARLVTSSADGTARVWDTQVPMPRDLGTALHALAVGPDGAVAVGREDNKVTVLRGGEAKDLSGHMGRVLAAAFSADGARLVTGGEDDRVLVWDVARQVKVGAIAVPSRVRGLAVVGDVVIILGDGRLGRASLTSFATLPELDAGGAPIATLAVSPRGLIAGATRDGTLVLWRDGAVVDRRALPVAITALGFSPDGAQLVIAGAGAPMIYALDRDRLAASPAATIDGPTGVVTAIAFTPGGWGVITASDDGVARIWDAAKGKLLATRHGRGKALAALGVHDDTLWLASEDGTVGAWPLATTADDGAAVGRFAAAHQVPERLDPDDVVRRDR
jgi:WD40 repeat protein/tRNA A-37 threonylcarbamoyl transferase component Bud32